MTYFGSAATPADNGTLSNASVATVTPPGSMVAGDLVVVLGQYRGDDGFPEVIVTGGQTWTTITGAFTTDCQVSLFYCIFNGTWSANPAFQQAVGGPAALSAIMHVFRPTSGFTFAGRDTGLSHNASYTAPSTPFDVTVPADTSTEARIVALAFFTSEDDNTWALQSGTWTNAGTAQYRNTSGTDQSNSTAYKFFTSIGTIDAVTNRQATLGGDHGLLMNFGFYETAPTGRSFGAIID